MDAAGLIYILYAAILFAGFICAALLLVFIYQYWSNKRVNRITLVLTVLCNTLFICVFFDPIVSALIVIPSMCKEYGGLHLYKKMEVDGFFHNVFDKRYLTDYGYSFVEYKDIPAYKNKYITKRISQNGDIEIDNVWVGSKPQSRYHYVTRKKFEIKKSGLLRYFNVRGERDYMLDTRENMIIAEIKRYLYAEPDLRYAMYRMLADKTKTCSPPERDPKNKPLLFHVLHPSG